MRKLVAPIIAAGSLNATAFAVDGNAAAAVGALVATVVVTLAIVKWIDERIAHKMRGIETSFNLKFEFVNRNINDLREIVLRQRGE